MFVLVTTLIAHAESSDSKEKDQSTGALEQMAISKKIFTPNKWWQFEGHEEELPVLYAVEETGIVDLGGRFTVHQGAEVHYYVLKLPTPQTAHKMFLHCIKLPPLARNVKRSTQVLHDGEEGFQYMDITLDNSRNPAGCVEEAVIRYGNYLVEILGKADLKVFGPKPIKGDRQFLCEPVFNKVKSVVFNKWKSYKTLLAVK